MAKSAANTINSFVLLLTKAIKVDSCLSWYYRHSIIQGRLFSSLPVLPRVAPFFCCSTPTHPPTRPPSHPLRWHTSEQDPAPFVLGSLFVSSWWTEQQHHVYLYSNTAGTTHLVRCNTSDVTFPTMQERMNERRLSCDYVSFYCFALLLLDLI